MNNLLARVAQSIRERKLFRRGEAILVAVSGGADSMVLLQLLHSLSAANDWRLCVAHFNHQLRGRSSEADERLVRSIARGLGLRFVCGAGDVKRQAKRTGISIEMAARSLRQAFLAKTAVRLGCRVIALAHHQDDQVELIFLRILRGAGAEGLAGMKWRNASPANRCVQLVRPLLDISKAELAVYATAAGVHFREDESNAATDILRNRVRHELLPFIRRHFQNGITETVSRLAEILGTESEFLDTLTRRWISSGKPAFEKLPVALQRRVLQIRLREFGLAPDFKLIERLRLHPDQSVTVSAGMNLARDHSARVRRVAAEPAAFQNLRSVVRLTKRSGAFHFGGLRIAWERQRKAGSAFEKQANVEQFDAARIGSAVVLRHWQAGDRFRPIGLGHDVKLQDWFTNQKIPRAKRHTLVVATTLDGTIFWVEGQRIDERFKLTAATRERLGWCWKRA